MSLGHPDGLRMMHEGFPGCPEFVPWAMLTDAHRRYAGRTNGQTLERLNERGGLSPLEFRAMALNRAWRDLYGYGSRGNGIGIEQYAEAVNFVRAFLGLPPLDAAEPAIAEWKKRKRL